MFNQKIEAGLVGCFPENVSKGRLPGYEAKRAILQLDTKQSESQFKDEDGERGV